MHGDSRVCGKRECAPTQPVASFTAAQTARQVKAAPRRSRSLCLRAPLAPDKECTTHSFELKTNQRTVAGRLGGPTFPRIAKSKWQWGQRSQIPTLIELGLKQRYLDLNCFTTEHIFNTHADRVTQMLW